jgi:NDP-sugar pyrophosphorylase family protein
MTGYVNRLADGRDLRQLVRDAFLSRCEIKPRGREVRPGVWIDDGARVHKFARLVAPVYVGRSAKVGPSAVITRCSNLERSCQVGEQTVVEASTVLPHTVLGSGLDVSHALVEGDKFVDLQRNVALQIDDPNLLHDATPLKRRVPAHRQYVSPPSHGNDVFEIGYSQYLSRAADRFSEVFFKG